MTDADTTPSGPPPGPPSGAAAQAATPTPAPIGAPGPAADPEELVGAVIGGIRPVDAAAAEAARAHDARLTKPAGSLGRIEELGFQLAAIAGQAPPPPAEPGMVVVFAADHGVHAEGVSPWPQAVTAQMVANFGAGGAAVNVIARANGLDVRVVDIGLANPVPDHEHLIRRPVRAGTANLRREAAMSRAEAVLAVATGAGIGRELVGAGARCLLTGEMGIANTTASAALVAVFTGADPAAVTGRGTGIDDVTLARKVVVVADALAGLRAASPAPDPLGVLAEIGGLEIAGIAGLCLAGAAERVPVIVDGVIALAGALVAVALCPDVAGYLIAGHRSVEPAATLALSQLGLRPLLELDLRLGEGTGAALAYPLVRAAARLPAEMATFDSAGIDGA